MKHSYKPRIPSQYRLNQLFKSYSSNIEQISFYHLKTLIDDKKSFNLFIGGYWCPNCIAIMPQVKHVIERRNLKLYMLDPRPFAIKKAYTDIRRSPSKESRNKLKYLLAHLLGNGKTENTSLSVPFITHIDNGVAKSFFQEEYVASDITPELSQMIINRLDVILR